MRSTCEIIAYLKDSKEVSYEELKMACLVQSSIIFFYKNDTKHLLKGGIGADMLKHMEYSDKETSSIEMGIPSWYWKAIKSDPYKYLSQKDIPGTDEWKKFHGMCTNIYNKVVGKSNETKAKF